MTIEELWKLLNERLNKIEAKIDKLNGQTSDHRWQLRGLWAVISAEAGLFLWWVKTHLQ